MMNNILIFATICVLAVSVLSIGVSMPVLAQENNTGSGNNTGSAMETNPESTIQPGMEINGTTMIANGTNATTTTPAPSNATFG
jgi:hypothetical protein